MKRMYQVLIPMLLGAMITVGCSRTPDDVWNDTKTAGRHVGRGVSTLGGKQGSSQQVKSQADFAAGGHGISNSDFIALDDEQERLSLQMGDAIGAAKETPGEAGSSIPGIEAFKDPAQDPELAPIFEHIHFDYNSSLVKNDENMKTVQNIASFMKSHPRFYVFVEGHCDKRGPSAYNFALGANRANGVRNALVQEGVSQDRLFTVSYGKEKLLFEEDGEEFHRLNRRAQFKVLEK